MLLAPTTYLLNIACTTQAGEVPDHRMSCCEFTLRDLVRQWSDRPGFFSTILPWDHSTPTPTGSSGNGITPSGAGTPQYPGSRSS
jgi:hypothetical protein